MYEKLNLKDNPFKDLTPEIGISDEPLVWAGLSTIKDKIEKVYNDTVTRSPRQVVLNWGPWGGGKTFSAIYFINNYKDINGTILTQAFIKSPKDGNAATDDFFKNIIDSISFSKIKKHINKRINEIGREELFDLINNKIRSEELANAILLLGSDDDEISSLMNRFVYSGVTKTELKKLGLPRDIQDNTDAIKFLAGLILTFASDGSNHPGKFILWIDEMEDLIYYSPKQYRAFSQVLRELMDILSQHFTLFMNFTFSEPEESTIELILGGAVWSRINNKIRFKELSIQDAETYVNDLVKSALIDKRIESPFDSSEIKTILEFIPPSLMTPREINKYFGGVLNLSMEKNETSISNSTIQEWLSRKSDDENNG